MSITQNEATFRTLLLVHFWLLHYRIFRRRIAWKQLYKVNQWPCNNFRYLFKPIRKLIKSKLWFFFNIEISAILKNKTIMYSISFQGFCRQRLLLQALLFLTKPWHYRRTKVHNNAIGCTKTDDKHFIRSTEFDENLSQWS